MSLTLDHLNLGQSGLVTGLSDGSDDIAARILALGFDSGARVELLHRAPFGGPLAVQVDDATVAIRQNLARLILVSEAP